MMDSEFREIQLGSGVVNRLERAWGHWRRWYLRKFRRAYVRRMQELRKGTFNPCPHEVIDPRDLKFYRNQGGWYWDPTDDPFTWRDNLPFVRDKLAELIVYSAVTFGGAATLAWLASTAPGNSSMRLVLVSGSVFLGVSGLLVAWFFRNPVRSIPTGDSIVVAPADGKVVDIEEIEHDDFLGGSAVKIGIFQSIFHSHTTRSPISARVVGLRHANGRYLNALRPESARMNAQLTIYIEGNEAPRRRMTVRQIASAIVRTFICGVRPGDELSLGQKFGMTGGRTELVLPRDSNLGVLVKPGDDVRAGTSIIAEYADS